MKTKKLVFLCGIVALILAGLVYAYHSYTVQRAAPPVKRIPPAIPRQIKKQLTAPLNKPTTSYDWMLTPAGVQKTLGDFPIGSAISPDHRYMVVSNDGVGLQSLQLIDLKQERVVQTIKYRAPEALYIGLAFKPDGSELYASAGGNNKIRVYDFKKGQLFERSPIFLPASRKHSFFPAGLTVSPDGHYLFVANNLNDSVSKINLSSRTVVATTKVGSKPYTVLQSRDGNRLYVTNWGESTVTLLNASNMSVLRTIDVGLHPNAIAENPLNGQIYVADSDSDQVSAIDPATSEVTSTYSLLPESSDLTGTQPDALTVNPDGKTLYVANAGNNDIAVINLSTGQVDGLIPTAWYPTGVFLLNEAGKLLVINAKGMGSGPNSVPNNDPQYVGNMMRGTLSYINVPSRAQLAAYTTQVEDDNHPIRDGLTPVPRWDPTRSPIKHIIYVIRENRTYDQIFGDIVKGNGDPSLVMFGNNITPNAHKLASQFVLLDNFYADAEVSAQGHNWATAAKANDYVEKNWPSNYSNRGRPSDFEGNDAATYPQDGFLWDDAARNNVTFRDYGEFYKFNTTIPNDPTIGDRYDPNFMGWNLHYSDVDRFKEWAKEYNQFEQNNDLPQFEILRLPNDHTAGTRPGFWTPQAMVAQNDYALGLLVNTVSHSPDWKDTAIFVTEDDAQAGVDHVDSHRTVSLVISPYTQTHQVDSTFYDTTSMLRTIELILGLQPMTQYDSAATPMLNVFTDKPNFAPFHVIDPIVSIDRYNTMHSLGARASLTLDFSQEDKADENTLNHVLWQATHGNTPYPGPDVAPGAGEDDDDDQ